MTTQIPDREDLSLTQSIGSNDIYQDSINSSIGSEAGLTNWLSFVGNLNGSAVMLQKLQFASNKTGGHVKFLPQLGCCPVIVGEDNQVVPLFEFIEAIDGLIDFDDLKVEFPSLSCAQMTEAISFLRKIAQFNIRDVDIDIKLEETEHQEFITEIQQAFLDKDVARVLYQDQQNV